MLPGLMYSLLVCFSCALLAKAVGSVNDPTPESHLSDLPLPSNPSSLLSTFNATSSLIDASVPNDMSTTCNGSEYGFKPDVQDCTSALSRQMVGRTQVTLRQRGSISSEEYLHLPYRLMGGM